MVHVVRDQGEADAPAAAEVSGPSDSRIGLNGASWLAIAVAMACAVALLYPVITAPITADDRYWYPMIGARTGGSIGEAVEWAWSHVPLEVESGRLTTLAFLERVVAGMVVIEAAVATATPVVVYQAALKLALVVGGLLTAVAFVRTLRWRDREGNLVRASRSTVLLVGVGGLVAIAVGAQAHSQFRNGWTSYPIFTYGSMVFIFGSVALVLWLARRLAENPGPQLTAVAVTVLVLLAAATNLSYELVYPAVPVAALALAIVPVSDRTRRAVGRRAKLVVGSAYLGSFTAVFIAIRVYLADVCAEAQCYEGVQLSLGPDAVRTAFLNVVSAVPGAAGSELRADLAAVGWEDRYPVWPTLMSVAIGVAAVAALLLLWWSTRPVRRHTESPEDSSPAGTTRRTEALLLAVGAGLSLLVGLGTAAVMAVSELAQALVTDPGTPYRNTMITWAAFALAAVLAVRAVCLLLSPRGVLGLWAAFAVLVGAIAVLTLPGNMLALRAYRVGSTVTEAISWELVKGDTRPGSEARRCELFAQLGDAAVAERARVAIYLHTNQAFRHYHGQAFCSDAQYPGAAA